MKFRIFQSLGIGGNVSVGDTLYGLVCLVFFVLHVSVVDVFITFGLISLYGTVGKGVIVNIRIGWWDFITS